jgi:hypothetical protein
VTVLRGDYKTGDHGQALPCAGVSAAHAVGHEARPIGTLDLDLYRIVSQLAEKDVQFKVLDDPAIDTSSRTGKLVMGILALIAEFENDIRRERQMDGIKKARERGTRFGREPLLIPETIQQVRKLRKAGKTVPEIMRLAELSKASVYRATWSGQSFSGELGPVAPPHVRFGGYGGRVRQGGACRRCAISRH